MRAALWYFWRLCYLGIALGGIVLFLAGGSAWGLPFLLGVILAACAYQISHWLTYGRWFE